MTEHAKIQSADPRGPFWIVMSRQPVNLNRCYHRHPTEEAANTEAQRLADAKPGARFRVFEAKGIFVAEAAKE